MAEDGDSLAGVVREPAPETGYPSGELIRPLGGLESAMYKCTPYQSANTVQAIWLSSDDPIDPNDVRQAVREVALKSEILQTCVHETFFRSWAKKMTHFVCDCSVTSQDPIETFHELMECSFDMKNGPMWKARLALPSTDGGGQHRVVLLLCIHHAMTDGTTNLLICRDIVALLNAKKKNQKIELPFRPVERPVDVIVDAWQPRGNFQLFCSGLRSLWSTFVVPCNNPLSIFNPGGPRGTGKLEIHRYSFSEDVTSKVAKQCKEHGVTVNCFVIAAANLALLRLLKYYQVDCREATIATENVVNLRRYLGPEEQEIHGFWASGHFIELSVKDTDLESSEMFWELVQTVSNSQTSVLKNKKPTCRISQYRYMPTVARFNKLMNTRHYKNFELCHIAANNIGDLNRNYFPPDKCDAVRVDDFLRSASSPYCPMLHSLLCHTLGGRLNIMFEHYGNKNRTEVTEKLLEYMVQFITSRTG